MIVGIPITLHGAIDEATRANAVRLAASALMQGFCHNLARQIDIYPSGFTITQVCGCVARFPWLAVDTISLSGLPWRREVMPGSAPSAGGDWRKGESWR